MASPSTGRWRMRQRQNHAMPHGLPKHIWHTRPTEHQKMARKCQRSNLVPSASRSSSSTPSCCWRATLPGIVATPIFLGYRPPGHPICESRITVIWRGGGSYRGTPTCLLTRASLSVNPAAPLLFRHAPASLPICESISTIVWVRWTRWRCWHHWWHDWLHWWQDRSKWRRCGWASAVVDSAAPRFLVCCPRIFVTHGAIERVHGTNRHRMCWWQRARWCGRWCRRWRGRWRGRWRERWRRPLRGERSGWNCHRGLRQSCGGTSRGATPAHGAAAELLLCLGPCCFPHQETIITIVREC